LPHQYGRPSHGVPFTIRSRGRLEAIRFVLDRLDYPDKDHEVVGTPDPLLVGPPSVVAADAGERDRHESTAEGELRPWTPQTPEARS
jgi:hypothetical protein